ncbi:lytic murein transglycosylase B [Aquicella lusitana]|uniref:Membrane-bound lytic murein transglycosylase B n=1 Tax=Aquicella lusitana TaxID=254246 RepID=A0A370GI41_9COXI|nr:lytic murein transglycosylase B [Aquicella lusitana]RDI42849.1 membrane-bound lytic murein transglycosylase B [Aquicella lusitana]VVC73092.1 Membrane-bound lytic murein transglycosylase B [Aquicella lusitana]
MLRFLGSHAFCTRIVTSISSILLGFALVFLSPAVYADMHFVERKDVQEFIKTMVKKNRFNKEQLVELFSKVKLRPIVVTHVKKPLEKKPWYTYQMLFVNEWRIQHGVQFWNKYETVLRKAEAVYKVPASIIVATIGIETKYGQRTGDYRVIDSLTNLAFSDSSRAPFFRRELEQFLLLAREQKLDPLKVMGSYAGAIGQPQFMPSSYRHYAVNFSGSGKTDLMNDEVDVIGSIANYYSKHGWKLNEPVAIQAATIGDRYNYLSRNNKIKEPLLAADLAKYGIIPKTKIVPENQKLKIIELQNRYSKEYWLGLHNFGVIKRYNSSDLYAMAVYQLSIYISDLRERLNNG